MGQGLLLVWIKVSERNVRFRVSWTKKRSQEFGRHRASVMIYEPARVNSQFVPHPPRHPFFSELIPKPEIITNNRIPHFTQMILT